MESRADRVHQSWLSHLLDAQPWANHLVSGSQFPHQENGLFPNSKAGTGACPPLVGWFPLWAHSKALFLPPCTQGTLVG